MWKKGLQQALLTVVRMVLLVFAFLCLLAVVRDRYETYVKNDIVVRRYISVYTEPWFEVAVCFGPKIPGDVVDQYMNKTWSRFPERYRTYDAWNSQVNRTETYFDGAMAVDSLAAYRQFFKDDRFNWTDGLLGISSLTPSLLRQHMDGIQHRISVAGKDVRPDTALRYTDTPFLLEYAICRNYSYNITFSGRNSGTLEHQIHVNDSVHEALFGIAWYIDLYVYPQGNFTEFSLIADHVPYRVDLRTHQLLEVAASKTEKMIEGSHHSVHSSSHTHVNCLTWCLARGLLDKVKCILPMQIPYIYNTSGGIPQVGDNLEEETLDVQWRRLYPPSAAWPWMKKYADLPLCRSSEEFVATFSRFTQVYFPRGSSRYPLSPHCAKECPQKCDEYVVVIHPAGTQLVPSKRSVVGKVYHSYDHESVHSVTFYHSTTLNVAKEVWSYGTWEFFIDVSGMTSFVMGLSIIAIHDWIFLFFQWVMQVIGLEELEDEEGEKIAEEEWQEQVHELEMAPVPSQTEGQPSELAADGRSDTSNSSTDGEQLTEQK